MKNQIKLSKIKQIFEKLGLDTHLLKDDSMVERKQLELNPTDNETCVAMISTIGVDSDGDIVVPEGIDFSIFKTNPVVFFGHNYAELPVGKIENIEVMPNGVQAKIKIATITDMGKDVWELIKAGFLRACSIGFVANEWIERGEAGFDMVLNGIAEKFKIDVENCQRIITRCTLYENSIVGLPANCEALIQSVSLKSKKFKEIKEHKQIEQKTEENVETPKTEEKSEEKPEVAKTEEKIEEKPKVAQTEEKVEEIVKVEETAQKTEEIVEVPKAEEKIEEKPKEEEIAFMLEVIDHIPTTEEIEAEISEKEEIAKNMLKELEAKQLGKIFVN